MLTSFISRRRCQAGGSLNSCHLSSFSYAAPVAPTPRKPVSTPSCPLATSMRNRNQVRGAVCAAPTSGESNDVVKESECKCKEHMGENRERSVPELWEWRWPTDRHRHRSSRLENDELHVLILLFCSVPHISDGRLRVKPHHHPFSPSFSTHGRRPSMSRMCSA